MMTPHLVGVLDGAPVGCVLLNEDLQVLSWSRVMAAMTGIPAEQVVGRHLAEHFPRFADPLVLDRLQPVVRQGLPTVFSARLGPSLIPAVAGSGRRHDVAVTRAGRDPLCLALWLTDVTDLLQRGERYREALSRAEAEAQLRAERERELERARDAAEAAVRAKAAFLATMSHELRTPLAGVIGMTDLLASMPVERAAKECIETIRVCADSLLSVINDVLDYSRAEAQGIILEQTNCDLEAVADDAIAIVTGRAQAKGLPIILRLDPDLPATVQGDPGRLRQILVNLLGNAVKFTARGQVVLSLSTTANRLHLSVQDTGIGMDAATCGRLFTPFTQAEAVTTRRYGGTGLGLAICHRLVQLMGGTISITSTPGKGSIFLVDLPLLEPSRRPVALSFPGSVLVVDEDELRRETLVQRLRSWSLQATGTSPSGVPSLAPTLALVDLQVRDVALVMRLRHQWGDATRIAVLVPVGTRADIPGADSMLTYPLRSQALRDLFQGVQRLLAGTGQQFTHGPLVLVADDDPVNRRLAQLMLVRCGCRVIEAADGESAVAMALVQRPVLVLMDWQMPGMDGIAAAQALREAWPVGSPCPPMVAVTANSLPGDRARCMDGGMNDYLAKPYRSGDLLALLHRWIQE